MPAGVLVPGVLGGLGLLQANQSQQDAANLQKQGLRKQGAVDDFRLGEMRKMGALADGYDPNRETAASIKQAGDVTQYTLANALRNMGSEYRSGGGVPGLSSEYMTNATSTANRVLDPLKAFAAEQASTATQRKAQLLSMASGAAPGNVADTYFRAASSMPQTSPAGGFQALMQAFQAYQGLKKPGGAGGTGDKKPASVDMAGLGMFQ